MPAVRRLRPIFIVLALGVLLAGCDKCGNWFGIFKFAAPGSVDACRTPPPPPQQ